MFQMSAISAACCKVFHLDVAMTIQICFNIILYMLQRSDGCCRGDETLGRRRGATEDGGAAGEGRGAAGEDRGMAGMERGGLDAGGAAGMGLRRRMGRV